MTLSVKDEYLKTFTEALIARTPSDIQNESGFDLTIGSPLRALGEGFCAVAAVSHNSDTEEFQKQAKETIFQLASVGKEPAKAAWGYLTITSLEDGTVYANTPVFHTSGGSVATVASDVAFTGAETKDVLVSANVSGADVAFAAGTLFLTPTGFSGTNTRDIDNGTDAETDYERISRFKKELLKLKQATIGTILSVVEDCVLTDENGIAVESVRNAAISFPWKNDPEVPPDEYGEILLYIRSSLGTPSQDLLDLVETTLEGEDETKGIQGAGQNIRVLASPYSDVAFTVPLKLADGYALTTVEPLVKSAIQNYIDALKQGESVNPTNWQSAAGAVEGVEYLDEANLSPSTIQTLQSNAYWNITSINVSEMA
ncbi:MAG: hypothetical protein GY866_00640 [Proteobacteria bacterium]|nr:hypothetical protein [Pseudomonadota bacterium]